MATQITINKFQIKKKNPIIVFAMSAIKVFKKMQRIFKMTITHKLNSKFKD